ncbi:inositol monophosphatase family protein [Phytopseudomonas dryadis]|uniref:Inositol-1-monophosphatase n=1 Tax=Phytopseudomonas dryadis TaxID=2487520 RepID=A0A4V2KBS3_9GAMM|nr:MULTISPECIES: inositol monophosphatase [Pseudomonas]TBU88304.1 inositol monophosphatase [Pseudomonas dryadis]TBV05487.1 inositol monophosphatase [Pseudomonas dryadis]TBV18496.1 inositol monophosphatase [Pseudomonas sp. FRB 230]
MDTPASIAPAAIDARYACARRVAREAAERGMAYYRQRDSLSVSHKGDDRQDVVSIADKELELFIRAELARQFPEDGFVGEEGGSADLHARCIWVIDPIDGTACFVNGLHNWCVSIGLMVDGQPLLGAIADPNHDELFHGCAGRGAFVNQTPLRVHGARHVREGLLGVGTTHRPGKEHFLPFISRLLDEGGMFLRNGSGALMTAYVAAGRLIGYYETHLKSWDCLAGMVLVREAGGRCNDFLRGDGLLGGNPYLVACPGVYEQVAAMIGPSLDGD